MRTRAVVGFWMGHQDKLAWLGSGYLLSVALRHLEVLANVLFAAAPYRENSLHVSLLSKTSGLRLGSCASGFPCWDKGIGW